MMPTFAPVTRMTLHPAIAPALPSATSALALVNGDRGALPLVVAHTTLRAGIISGQRHGVVRNALVASVAIEAFVLGWALYQKSRGAPVTA